LGSVQQACDVSHAVRRERAERSRERQVSPSHWLTWLARTSVPDRRAGYIKLRKLETTWPSSCCFRWWISGRRLSHCCGVTQRIDTGGESPHARPRGGAARRRSRCCTSS